MNFASNALKVALGAIVFAGVFGLNLALVYYVFPSTPIGWFVSKLFFDGKGGVSIEESDGLKIFDCDGPLPPFSLGLESNPTHRAAAELCDCVWKSLPESSKEFAKVLENNSNSTTSAFAGNAFAVSVGVALRSCGADRM